MCFCSKTLKLKQSIVIFTSHERKLKDQCRKNKLMKEHNVINQSQLLTADDVGREVSIVVLVFPCLCQSSWDSEIKRGG